ncbi:MAG: mycofactocin-coupled SDR family oxidoreductase [Dehalococcoidia bacterium]
MRRNRFQDKVAFVTGAARGQGRSHAVALAAEGADIVAVDICADVPSSKIGLARAEDLAETVALVERLGRRIVARQADVRDSAALQKTLEEGVGAFGRLDVVCANAGILSAEHAVDYTEQEWRDVIDVDLTGVWNTCRLAVPHLRAGGRGGAIVLTSSVCGLIGVPGLAAYNAAKHGVVGLMRTLAIELGPDRIRVNTVNPGNVDTPMIQNDVVYSVYFGDGGATRDQAAAPDSPFSKPNLLPTPWVQPEDVSNAVLFLASDEGRFITGVSLPVDAGFIDGRWS